MTLFTIMTPITYRQKQALAAYMAKKLVKKKRNYNRFVNSRRQKFGEYFNLIQEIRSSDPEIHFQYFRMSKELFDVLLEYVETYISHSKNHALPISPAERLAVTLRYLATGDSQQTICFSYRIGKSTMSSILKETCMALWRCLKDKYLLLPTTAVQWKNIASGFSCDWQLKNCIGALDGKHVRIQAPKHSGSEFYNYKAFLQVTSALYY